MTDYTELKLLVDRVLTDRRFCGDENHKALADGVLALTGENQRLNAENKQLILLECHGGTAEAAINLLAERDQLKAENEALRNALMECTDSLQGEMLQKFGGQLPEDMHPVTRREYDRDIAEVSGYRAALGQGEQS